MRIRYHKVVVAVPTMLALAAFYYAPAVFGLVGSFFYWTMDTMEWSGWANYEIVLSNPFVSVTFVNSLVFAFSATAAKTTMGFLLAFFIDHLKKRYRLERASSFLRSVFFLPATLSTIAIGAMFTVFLHPALGVVNRTLGAVGFPEDWLPGWLVDPHLAMASVVGIETWMWTGFVAAFVLAALQAVPKDYYEAAAVDGASSVQQQLHITIPAIWPTLANLIVFQLIVGFKVFDLVLVTTNGGPGVSTKMLSQVVYDNITSDMGSASAANSVMVVIILAIALGANALLARKDPTS